YDVTGLFMKNWDVADETGQCSFDQDLEDAELVCKTLNIELHQVNFVKQYWNLVFSEMVKDYQKGITPNPDVLCNKLIKFDAFLRHAVENLGGEALATGHYARTSAGFDLQPVGENSGVKLLKAVDCIKDQTFFLSQIPQSALQRTVFPLGEFTKDVTKTIALEAGFEKIVQKKESMGICFIGSRQFRKFIEEYTEPTPGKFIDVETGKIVGEHKGVHYWTVGQRALIAGLKQACFIVSKDVRTQDIIVASGTDHPALYCQTFVTEPPHWICGPPQALIDMETVHVDFRFQHGHPLVPCSITMSDGGLGVELQHPMRAITPGQYAVFYHHDECLGSARILNTGPSSFTLTAHYRM
ncbi:hypothetical protein BaRGS_00014817, partial [Batillaria attramentaria]